MAGRKRAQHIQSAKRRKIVVEALTPTPENPHPTLEQAAKAAGYASRSGALAAFKQALRDYPKEAMKRWLDTARDIHVQLLEAHLPIALGKGTAKSAKQITRKDAADVVLKSTADMNKIHDTYAATKIDAKHEVVSFVHEDLVAKLNNLVREEDGESEGDAATDEPDEQTEDDVSASTEGEEPGRGMGVTAPEEDPS